MGLPAGQRERIVGQNFSIPGPFRPIVSHRVPRGLAGAGLVVRERRYGISGFWWLSPGQRLGGRVWELMFVICIGLLYAGVAGVGKREVRCIWKE